MRISYQTIPEASGLQMGGGPRRRPTRLIRSCSRQSQAIHARSWIPLQDSPQVRIPSPATIHVSTGMRAVMSAENIGSHLNRTRCQRDLQVRDAAAIPSYLIALGGWQTRIPRATGPRTLRVRRSSLVEAQLKEFAGTEQMIQASGKLFGPYRWGRYDLLILPPSFPFGGMENPLLSFITQRSSPAIDGLTALIAPRAGTFVVGQSGYHATWRDLGSTKIHRLLQGASSGGLRERREAMEAMLDLPVCKRSRHTPPAIRFWPSTCAAATLTTLHACRTSRARGSSAGSHHRFGADPGGQFLRDYFDKFAFQSISTEDFPRLPERQPAAAEARCRKTRPSSTNGSTRPGLPKSVVLPHSDAFVLGDAARKTGWRQDRPPICQPRNGLRTNGCISSMECRASSPQRTWGELDAAFALTATGNAEIALQLARIVIRNDYAPAVSATRKLPHAHRPAQLISRCTRS